MKSYQQYCAVARALDVVGDRWVLLIVRELMAFGPSRFSDLQRGLPGIASNLLAERLRSMETAGLIERHEAPAPIGSQVYQLTARGRELEDVLRALTRWGMGRMPSGPTDGDAVQPQWTGAPRRVRLCPNGSRRTEVVLGIETSIGSEGRVTRRVRPRRPSPGRVRDRPRPGRGRGRDACRAGPTGRRCPLRAAVPSAGNAIGPADHRPPGSRSPTCSATALEPKRDQMTYTERDLASTIERLAGADLGALTQTQLDGLDQFHVAEPKPSTDCCRAWA